MYVGADSFQEGRTLPLLCILGVGVRISYSKLLAMTTGHGLTMITTTEAGV